MRFYQFQAGCDGLAFQSQILTDLRLCHVFQHIDDGLKINLAAGNLAVAMLAPLQDKIIRGNRHPEALIIHRLQPVLNIFNIFEIIHGLRISNLSSQLQKLHGKRGRI